MAWITNGCTHASILDTWQSSPRWCNNIGAKSFVEELQDLYLHSDPAPQLAESPSTIAPGQTTVIIASTSESGRASTQAQNTQLNAPDIFQREQESHVPRGPNRPLMLRQQVVEAPTKTKGHLNACVASRMLCKTDGRGVQHQVVETRQCGFQG